MKIKIGNVELNLRCVLCGHKISDTTDSGFCYCIRCNAHEWYSLTQEGIDDWAFTLPHAYWWLKHRIKNLFTIQRCDECRKVNNICGFWVGKHDNCNLPF